MNINKQSISSYNEYQEGVTTFWSNVNDLQHSLNYLSVEKFRENIVDIGAKVNAISFQIPILEEGKKYQKEGDGKINFREIFFSILEAIKFQAGTAIIDKKNVSFNYPSSEPSISTLPLQKTG